VMENRLSKACRDGKTDFAKACPDGKIVYYWRMWCLVRWTTSCISLPERVEDESSTYIGYPKRRYCDREWENRQGVPSFGIPNTMSRPSQDEHRKCKKLYKKRCQVSYFSALVRKK
jgi:hypothetical protein